MPAPSTSPAAAPGGSGGSRALDKGERGARGVMAGLASSTERSAESSARGAYGGARLLDRAQNASPHAKKINRTARTARLLVVVAAAGVGTSAAEGDAGNSNGARLSNTGGWVVLKETR